MEIINIKQIKKEYLTENNAGVYARRLVRKVSEEKQKPVSGFVYIVCPTVSDLFIVTSNKARKCTKEEWKDYFYKYIV